MAEIKKKKFGCLVLIISMTGLFLVIFRSRQCALKYKQWDLLGRDVSASSIIRSKKFPGLRRHLSRNVKSMLFFLFYPE